MSVFAKRFASLRPYVPGEQPKDRPYVKLNANENPYPPSPAVAKAIRDFDPASLRLYPDPDAQELRASIAALVGHGVKPSMVFVGNGSDEVLSFVFFSFFDSDSPLVFPEHTYSFYPVYAGYYDIPVRKVPLRTDFSIDADAMLSGPRCGIIFPNPNAPTGMYMPLSDVREFLRRAGTDRVVVVDEAYIDFGGESAVSLLGEFPNLLIIRTFSKSLCFAGARLGFAVGNESLIDALFTTKNSFNHFPVDRLTQKIGVASCGDREYYIGINGRIARARDRFASEIRASGWEVLPSLANFVFARKAGLTGREAYERIKERGILVRHFATQGIEDFVRISIGTDEDMSALAKIMETLK
jgi:histidinol-phosphate aminotransferase